jgi:hypothetical protein
MFYATFNNGLVIYRIFAVARGVLGARVLCHFEYCFNHFHSFAVGRGFRKLMFYATFNNVLVIYRIFAVARGVLGAHVFCHF